MLTFLTVNNVSIKVYVTYICVYVNTHTHIYGLVRSRFMSLSSRSHISYISQFFIRYLSVSVINYMLSILFLLQWVDDVGGAENLGIRLLKQKKDGKLPEFVPPKVAPENLLS